MKRARVIVDGVVQGVGYRYNVKHAAMKHKVKGYVKNLDDGRVEVVAEGEEDSLAIFLEEIRIRREPIMVESMDVVYEEPKQAFKTFKIITGSLEEEMAEGFSTGAMYFNILLNKQDQMLAKQDQMLAKQDQMLAKQDQTIQRLDDMMGKLDDVKTSIVNEIQILRNDIRSILDERLAKIEEDLARIKSRLGMS